MEIIEFRAVFFSNHPANTGKPIVAVLTRAPAKIRNGIKGYLLIMSLEWLLFIGNYTMPRYLYPSED